MAEVNWDEYMERALADKERMETCLGRSLTENEEEGLGVMVYRILLEESKQRERTP